MSDFNNNFRDQRSLRLTEEEKDRNNFRTDDYREETAAEVAPGVTRPFVGTTPAEEREEVEEANFDQEGAAGRGVGTFALVLAILSLFFLPIILGAGGIIIGFVARRNGANALGNWAIGIGAISIILTVFFAPFF